MERSEPIDPREELANLYDSLPKCLQTGYFHFLNEDPSYSTAEKALEVAKPKGLTILPYIVVKFKNGKGIELHIDTSGFTPSSSLDDDISKMKDMVENILGKAAADTSSTNIATVEAVWRPLDLAD